MKITVKTLQQKVFQIDAEGSDTVADLKNKIQQSQGHAVETQKLIYSGKILADAKTVESCEIKEKDFLVLMVSKPKPAPAAPAASSSSAATPDPAPAAAPTAAPAPAPAPATEAASAPSAPQPPNAPILTPAQAATPAPANQQRPFGDTNSFLTGEALQSTIANMMEMGFERDQVMRALRASFNNPDRAVEYLFNGIPAHLQAMAAGPQAAAAPPPAAAGGNAPAPAPAPAAAPAQPAPTSNAPQNLFQLAQQQQQHPPASNVPGLGGAPQPMDFAALQNHPQMQQLRELITTNPQLAQPLIQQIAQQNPQLAQLLAHNPEALLQLLGGAEGDFEDDMGEGGLPPGAQVVHITEAEQQAIQRLEALGFPRQAVIEAYFACDKNEELAANYLFDSNFEDS
ncbi:UV excision repair protein Rad23 [Wolfiporia cocos MD-104 SS10]|uniref:UV excision repair protein RAD23 n=1 Tax=Wolfiporia cocos (strain MD-104) TaxID=742152 RepID=A0A2H3JER3_WOLCO|nr:UV excision repair protein Rad23 [Wolfiporia cocos MD-104 SS10]